MTRGGAGGLKKVADRSSRSPARVNHEGFWWSSSEPETRRPPEQENQVFGNTSGSIGPRPFRGHLARRTHCVETKSIHAPFRSHSGRNADAALAFRRDARKSSSALRPSHLSLSRTLTVLTRFGVSETMSTTMFLAARVRCSATSTSKRTIFSTHDTRGPPQYPGSSHLEVDEHLWRVHHKHRAHQKTPSRCFRRRAFQRRHTSARPVCPMRTMSGNLTLGLSNLDRIRAATSCPCSFQASSLITKIITFLFLRLVLPTLSHGDCLKSQRLTCKCPTREVNRNPK